MSVDCPQDEAHSDIKKGVVNGMLFGTISANMPADKIYIVKEKFDATGKNKLDMLYTYDKILIFSSKLSFTWLTVL